MLKSFITAALRIAIVLTVVIGAARLIGGGLDENYITYLQMDILSATAFDAAPADVYLLAVERTFSVNLTRTAELTEQNPAWSPDGRYILFDRQEIVGYSVCVIAPFENAAPRCLDVPPRLVHLGWDMDSETIYVRNVDTNQIRTASVITGQYSGDYTAQAAVGEREIFYSADRRYRVTYDGFQVWFSVQDLQSGRTWSYSESAVFASPPTIASDGARLLFAAYMPSMIHSDIYTIEEGSSLLRVTDTQNETERFPAWSPDGAWLVYTVTRGGFGATGTQVYVMRPDGSETRRLTFDRAVHTSLSWRP